MKLYLAGPMRGYPLYNFNAFADYADRLRAQGHDVFSPAEKDEASGFDPSRDQPKELAVYMIDDLPEVLRADAVALMPGWEYSTGATLEALVGLVCEKPLLDADRLLAIPAHPALTAFVTVRDILKGGLGKHAPDTWRAEPGENHLLKCARHAVTAQLIDAGLQKAAENEEDHVGNAICRSAMRKAQLVGRHVIGGEA